MLLDPLQIRFTQASCRHMFGTGLLLSWAWCDAMESVLSGQSPSRQRSELLAPIEVVYWRGRHWSLDNRRLAVFKLLAMSLDATVRIRCWELTPHGGPAAASQYVANTGQWDTACEGQCIFIRHACVIVSNSWRECRICKRLLP